MPNHPKTCCCDCDYVPPAAFIYIGPDTSGICGKIEHEEPRYYANNFPYLFNKGLCESWYLDKCSPFCMQNEDVIHPYVDADLYEIDNHHVVEQELLDDDGNPVLDDNGKPIVQRKVRVGLEVHVSPISLPGQEDFNRGSTWWPFGDRDSMSGGFDCRENSGYYVLDYDRCDEIGGCLEAGDDPEKSCLPDLLATNVDGTWAENLHIAYGDPNPYTDSVWGMQIWPGLCTSWCQGHVISDSETNELVSGRREETVYPDWYEAVQEWYDTGQAAGEPGPGDEDWAGPSGPWDAGYSGPEGPWQEPMKVCGENHYDLPMKKVTYDRYSFAGPPNDPLDQDPEHIYRDPGAKQAAAALYLDIEERFGPQKLSNGALNPLPSQIYFGVDNSGSMGWCTSPGDPVWECPSGCYSEMECEPDAEPEECWPGCCPLPENFQTVKIAPFNPGAWQIAKELYEIFVANVGEENAEFKFNPYFKKFKRAEQPGDIVFLEEPNAYSPERDSNYDGPTGETEETSGGPIVTGSQYCAGHGCNDSCFLWDYPANPDYWWFADLLPPVLQHRTYVENILKSYVGVSGESGFESIYRLISDDNQNGILPHCGKRSIANSIPGNEEFLLGESLYYCDCNNRAALSETLAPYVKMQMALPLQAWELPVFFYDESPLPYSLNVPNGMTGSIQDTDFVSVKTGEDYLGGFTDMMAKHFGCCNCSPDKVEGCGWPDNRPVPGWWECEGVDPQGGPLGEKKAHCGWGGSAFPEEFDMGSPITFRSDLQGNTGPMGEAYRKCYDGAAPCTLRYMAPFKQISQFEIPRTIGEGVCPTANIHQKGVPCDCPSTEPPRLPLSEWPVECDPPMVFPCPDALIEGPPDYNPGEEGGEFVPEPGCDPDLYKGSPDPWAGQGEDYDKVVCVKDNCCEDDSDPDCVQCWITSRDECINSWGGTVYEVGACCLWGRCIETAEPCCVSKGGDWYGVGTDCDDPDYKYCPDMEDQCDPDLCYYWFSMTYDPAEAAPGEECIPTDPCEAWNGNIDMDNWGSNVFYSCCNTRGWYECQNSLECPGESQPPVETGCCCSPWGEKPGRTREACELIDPDSRWIEGSCTYWEEDPAWDPGNGAWASVCGSTIHGACCLYDYEDGTKEYKGCYHTDQVTCMGCRYHPFPDVCWWMPYETDNGFLAWTSCLDADCATGECKDSAPSGYPPPPPEYVCRNMWEDGETTCFWPNCCQLQSNGCRACAPCPCGPDDVPNICACPSDFATNEGCGAAWIVNCNDGIGSYMACVDTNGGCCPP